jgi:hypothetical protein
MRYMIMIAALLSIFLCQTPAAHAERIPQTSGARVPLSFMGARGESILIYANVVYERKAELVEPILDWGAMQWAIMRPIVGAGLVRGIAGPLKADDNYRQMIVRAFEHAKQLRTRDLPNGRLWTLFEFVGGIKVKDPQDVEAALAIAFLSVQDGRRIEPIMILGGLDSQGRLTAVADFNAHVTSTFNLGFRKVIVPLGQGSEISGPLQQRIEKDHLTIIEAATLKDLDVLVLTESPRD